MRGPAAILLGLIVLFYIAGTDAHSLRFASLEEGSTDGEGEGKELQGSPPEAKNDGDGNTEITTLKSGDEDKATEEEATQKEGEAKEAKSAEIEDAAAGSVTSDKSKRTRRNVRSMIKRLARKSLRKAVPFLARRLSSRRSVSLRDSDAAEGDYVSLQTVETFLLHTRDVLDNAIDVVTRLIKEMNFGAFESVKDELFKWLLEMRLKMHDVIDNISDSLRLVEMQNAPEPDRRSMVRSNNGGDSLSDLLNFLVLDSGRMLKKKSKRSSLVKRMVRQDSDPDLDQLVATVIGRLSGTGMSKRHPLLLLPIGQAIFQALGRLLNLGSNASDLAGFMGH